MTQTTLRDYLQSAEDAISAGRIDEAMANCQHILSFFPDAIEAQRLLGEVYLAKGQLEEAQQTFDWILANDPENVITYCNRALLSERMSDIDTALDCYQQAYELSRGNSNIRQQFNQLSAKAGQQEFMFSRAGLARLYMRGDLLTQAIQEWEAVLAASPERLDARIGLLETYWRENIYDKVEQMATQILEEIPTSLKALLLLAHVTSAYDMERAKGLIARAEALDPELIMAQELYSDLLASQSNDPFLSLLKKEPIIISDEPDDKQASIASTGSNADFESNGTHSPAESSDQAKNWSNLESWSELDTIHNPQNRVQPLQEASGLASWSDITNIQKVDSWATLQQASQHHVEPDLETWQESQEIDHDFDPAILEQQPWFQADQFKTSTGEPETTSEPGRVRENLSTVGSVESIELWTSPHRDDLPKPPAWLDMLTKNERQPSGSMPVLSNQSSSVQELAHATQQSWEEDFSTIPSSPEEKEEPAFFFASEDNDPDMGWPEWLKSLGAETLENEPEAVAPATELPLASQTWADQIDHALSKAEEQPLATLELLENDLRSQGFVPLQPGTLSTIAQEPSLSSALAQLGNLTAQPAMSEPPIVPIEPVAPIIPMQPAQPHTVPSGQLQPAEPELAWADALKQDPNLPQTSALEQPNSFGSDIPTASNQAGEAPDQFVDPAVATSATNVSQETPLMPAHPSDTLLENGLETTMRRPAVRLQPMQHAAAQSGVSYVMSRERQGERAAGKAPDSHLSSKERLLRGYQFQLVGAYDDAMQEYRILIRIAPELLGEVISNVRALLKLAPKYSAGYRVLGDAYMRQGEYLQAMEAYNRALTMAKKAKSQSN